MRKYHHAYTTIDIAALRHNCTLIQSYCKGKKILAIVKKNAYGHGLVEVAKALENQVDYLGVIYPEEGVQLRKAGIQKAILVVGAILPQDISVCTSYQLEFALFSLEQLQEIKKLAPISINVHLKIDTGMGRIGIPWDDAEDFIKTVKATKTIHIKGVFTHLACADTPNIIFTNKQVKRFKHAVAIFEKNNWELPLLHVAASGGILHYPESHFDMVRPGHILYGVYPDKDSERKLDIKPVLSLYATVLFSKRVKAGDTVGYGNVFIAPEDTWISTISIGYGDGFPRALTGKGRVLVREMSFPISSSVCMDQLMIATGDTELMIGEEVTLIGNAGSQQITCDEIAAICQTVPDKILSGIHPDVPKNFINNADIKMESMIMIDNN